MTLKSIGRSVVLVVLLTLSSTASGFSVRTESWSEDALLHDGRIIKVSREVGYTFQLFYGGGGSPGMFGSWPDRFWLKFKHPDTHETIKWQGEQYFDPVLLEIVDEVPYLVIHGRPDKSTEKIYGCPELPYIFLKYEKGFMGKWTPITAEQAPDVLQDANLSPDYPDFPRQMDQHDEAMYEIYNGRSSRDLSRDQVLMNIRKVEGSSEGNFQAKIPRSYDDWYSINDSNGRKERRRNDCRAPLIRPLPSPKFEVARQRINEAGLKAETVNATIESFAASPQIITREDFAGSKGVWTGHGYLSNRCDGIVKTIEPIREYFDNGGWHLTGSQLVLNPGEKLPFQQTNLSKFQAPAIPQLVTCGNNVIYAVSRANKENLLIYRFTNSGEVIDALHIALSDADKVFTGKEWGEIWEVMPTKDQLSIVLADYTYASTANEGGTINRKQTYAVKLPKFREPVPNIIRSGIEQKVDQAPGRNKLKVASQDVQKAAIRTFRDCPSCPEMIVIPGKNYALGKYEVTQAEWTAAMGEDVQNERSGPTVGSDKPVLYKDLDRAQKYITQLSKMTGRNYRLPTEAEWEFACYSGSQTAYCGGDDFDSVAWYKKDGKYAPHPVGQKQANGYGLYDMSGNVWEWMSDCWKDNCELRILRGGSFTSPPLTVLAAYIYGKKWGDVDIGFRLAGTLNDKRDGLLPVDASPEEVVMPPAPKAVSMPLASKAVQIPGTARSAAIPPPILRE